MTQVIPHLWFDTQARQAAEFYTDVFPDSRIHGSLTLEGTPSGSAQSVAFSIGGREFLALNGGSAFTINPSISFILNFDPKHAQDAEAQLRRTWAALEDGGQVLVPLGQYPFATLFGWVQDRFGVSWQLILGDPSGGEDRPFVTPLLMFVGQHCGRAEEATDFYMSVLPGGRRGVTSRYGPGQEPDREGTVSFTDFQLAGQWWAAMDSAQPHQFTFNEAVSLMVTCQTQAEIDEYWAKLSAVPEAEQCGWLKDRYGVSWQIVPEVLSDMMATGTREQVQRVTAAFLPMKKFDIGVLEEAFHGRR